MEILSEKENSDGYTFEVELTEEEKDIMILEGFEAMIEEEGYAVVVKSIPEHYVVDTDAKTHELSEGEIEVLINLGFNRILKASLDKFQKEQDELEQGL